MISGIFDYLYACIVVNFCHTPLGRHGEEVASLLDVLVELARHVASDRGAEAARGRVGVAADERLRRGSRRDTQEDAHTRRDRQAASTRARQCWIPLRGGSRSQS